MIIHQPKEQKAGGQYVLNFFDVLPGSTSVQSDGSVTIHILFDQVQSSHHLAHCSVVCEDGDFSRDPQQIFVFVLFTCETWKQLGLHVGATVKIYPPW